MSAFAEHSFQASEVKLHYACGPANGPPVVMFHGVCRRWQDFMPLAPALCLRWQLFALDHRGHGESAWTSGYRVLDYVDDACEFVRATFDQPVVLYGHSLGAMVAAAVAGRLVDRVRAVVLEDPPFGTMGMRLGGTALWEMFSAWQSLRRRGPSGREGVTDELVEALAHELAEVRAGGRRLGDLRDAVSLRFTAWSLLSMDPEVLSPVVQGDWLAGYDLAKIAATVRCPALLLRADVRQGGMLDDGDEAVFTASAKRCTTIRIEGAGHLLHWFATDTILRSVLAFLESLRSGPPGGR